MRGRMQRLMKWARGVMQRHMLWMMTCQEFEDFVLAYLDGELPERQTFVFELHLKMCPECREYLAAYERTVEVTKRAFEEPAQPLPEEVPQDLVKAILAAKKV